MFRRRFRALAFFSLTVLFLVPMVAWSDTHIVQMRNAHPGDKKRQMVFMPRVLLIEPGDTVRFVASDPSHNSEAIPKMNAPGALSWRGKLNEEVELTFDVPGHYAYQCRPHKAMGMVGVIIVEGEGALDHLDIAKSVKQRGKAKTAWEEIWAEVDGLVSRFEEGPKETAPE